MRHPAMRYLLLFDRSIADVEKEEGEGEKVEEREEKQNRRDQEGNMKAQGNDDKNTTLAKVKIPSSTEDEQDINGKQTEELVNHTFNDIDGNSDAEDDRNWEDASTSSSSSSSPSSSHSPSSSTSLKSPSPNESTTSTDQLVGFLSFMITDEEGAEVIYTYELDIHPSYQKLGLGKKLMVIMEAFGDKVQVEKSMLTCFNSNIGARRFYENIGYVGIPFLEHLIYSYIFSLMGMEGWYLYWIINILLYKCPCKERASSIVEKMYGRADLNCEKMCNIDINLMRSHQDLNSFGMVY